MATRNQTALFKRYRESLQNARRPFVATGGPGGGGSIELVEAPLLNQGGPRGYNAIVGDDAGASRYRSFLRSSLLPSLLTMPISSPEHEDRIRI
jgi:hypothetical protein